MRRLVDLGADADSPLLRTLDEEFGDRCSIAQSRHASCMRKRTRFRRVPDMERDVPWMRLIVVIETLSFNSGRVGGGRSARPECGAYVDQIHAQTGAVVASFGAAAVGYWADAHEPIKGLLGRAVPAVGQRLRPAPALEIVSRRRGKCWKLFKSVRFVGCTAR